jgi:hypothetical protein
MSKSIEKRPERIEGKLGVNKPHLILEIVDYSNYAKRKPKALFGDELLPEQTVGGITIRHIPYADLQQEQKAIESNER